ncbi:MAG TPA: hypothetical protein VNF50_10600 [Acidimicrobiales bacterium]|nr:hypothetical protein [Acidimicrobiales bacterium]
MNDPSLTTDVASSFALVVGMLLALALLLAFLAGQVNLGKVSARARRRVALLTQVGSLRSVASPFDVHNAGGAGTAISSAGAAGARFRSGSGDNNMPLQRSRLMLGLGVLAAAAVIGIVGWYKLAGEPLLNRQIPYLASAGVAVVILAAIGGALLVADQLRGDDHRMDDLEAAVRTLADSLAPIIESPARLRDRTRPASSPRAAVVAHSSQGDVAEGEREDVDFEPLRPGTSAREAPARKATVRKATVRKAKAAGPKTS